MGFYSVIGFLRPAIYFFLLPVYISFFTVSEYAIYNLMIDFAAVAMIFSTLRLNNAMLTHYYDYLSDEAQKLKYLRTSYYSSLFIGIAFIILMYFFGAGLFQVGFKDEAIVFFPFGMMVVIYSVLFEVNQVYINYLKNEKNISRFTLIMLIHILGIILLQFIFIIPLNKGVQGALEAILIGNVLVFAIIYLLDRKTLKFDIDLSMLKSSLRFSIVLIPYLVIYWFLSRGGRFFLESYTDLESVAVFALVMVLGGIILLAEEAVINGVRPFLFEEFAKKENADSKTIKLLTRMAINFPLLAVPAVILVSCFLPLISSNNAYSDLSKYMPLTCLLFFLLVWSKLFYQQLLYEKKSKVITLLSLVTTVFLISGFVLLIPGLKIWGVIFATIIANCVNMILFYVAAQRIHRVKHDYFAIFGTPIIIFALIFLIEYLCARIGVSDQWFGFLQFIVCLTVLIYLNRNLISDYRQLFRLENK